MNIGEKLIKLRKEKHMTQEQLSEMLGITRQTLSNWESNITSPNLKDINKLSETFNISIDELIGKRNISQKVNKKLILYFIILLFLIIVSIIAFTKKDYTKSHQAEISCRLNGKDIDLLLEENDGKYYIHHSSTDDSGDIFAGNTVDEAFKNLQTTKQSLLEQGAFCK